MIYDHTQLENYQSGVFEEMPALPDDAKGKYDIFKKYIGDFYFYSELYFYLMDALREDDIHSITAAIFEIEATRKDNRLLDPKSRAHLYREGRRYVAQLVKNPAELENYDSRQLILMICVLFENNYFDAFVLPDEAFEIGGPAPHLEILGEVYGTYFTFYNYLQEKLKELTVRSPQDQPESIIEPKKKKPEHRTDLTFKDIFKPEDKEKYNKIIDLLSKEMPIAVTKVYPKLDEQFISISGNDISWNPVIRNAKSYIAGIFSFCASKYWIETYYPDEYTDAVSKTFKITFESSNRIKLALDKKLPEKYIAPFRLLFAGM